MTTDFDPGRVTALGVMSDTSHLPPMSPFDETILQQLNEHLTGEAEILAEYRRLSASADAPVRYIAQLILEDEERHHRVLSELANQFRASAALVSQEPRVPFLTKPEDRRALAQTVRRLRKFERHDLRQLRKLSRRLRPIRNHSLDNVLVRTLEMDTRKHLRYLRELKRIARGR